MKKKQAKDLLFLSDECPECKKRQNVCSLSNGLMELNIIFYNVVIVIIVTRINYALVPIAVQNTP